jgi:non-canonical purine NTP pyrophosphatase (RdgB/HAM1 family)
MRVYFITGNKNKFLEAKSVLPELQQLEVDLPEIQSLDAKEIIKHKLRVARKQFPDKAIIVEDTSLYFERLNGLPGPLVKHMLESLGTKGLYKFAWSFNITKAAARVMIGFSEPQRRPEFFSALVTGQIVYPRGESFGWDSIFQPDGSDKTFAELGPEGKAKFSMRTSAFKKLKDYLG